MLDQTMLLAPDPAGTSMIGESTIEAAARRGLAKRRLREEELQQARQSGSDVYSEAITLAPQNVDARDRGARHDGENESESASVLNARRVVGKVAPRSNSKSSGGNGVGKIRSAWRGIQRRLR
jgi:hypothetical protein